jgi:transposase
MQVKQAFRFELDPNREARIALAKHVGAARFAYNWGLARCLEAQARGERIPSAVDLHKDWNEWKRKHAPWWVEVSKCAPQEAFRDLERAVRNWREGRAGFPRFKRKKALADNKARLTGSIRVTPRHVQLPRIGKVRTKERTDKLLELLQSGKARLSQRVFHCGACGLEADRDLNAALNLRNYGLAALKGPTGSSPGSDACGDPSGGGTAREGRSTSHGSMKQEAARHEFHPRRVK